MKDVSTKKLFGTSGIRGVLGRNIFPATAYVMGIAFARFLGNSPRVIVGCDVRIHSWVLYHQVIMGLVQGGASVSMAGITPTPALIHTQLELAYQGSVMVTGSHAIPSVTGLLFFLKDGGETDPDSQFQLERLYPKALSMKSGGGRIEDGINSFQIYYKRIAKSSVSLDGMKIAFDSGNGSMAGIAGRLLEEFGAKTILLNDTRNGNFPSRSPYPRRETLKGLRRTVIETKAELGVATDGDGDRAIFVTDDGQVLDGDVIGSLLADEELHFKKGKIVAPINSSNLINYICKLHSAQLISTSVGPPQIIQAIRNDANVVFAFEETGKYIWPDQLLYGDAIFSTLKLVSLLKRRGTSLRYEVGLLPKYYMEKKAVRCKEEEKERILKKALRFSKKLYPEAKFILQDGIKIIFDNSSWILLRPSGTEPFFRCYAESESKRETTKLISEGMKILHKSIN
jgi:phosphomannomutase